MNQHAGRKVKLSLYSSCTITLGFLLFVCAQQLLHLRKHSLMPVQFISLIRPAHYEFCMHKERSETITHIVMLVFQISLFVSLVVFGLLGRTWEFLAQRMKWEWTRTLAFSLPCASILLLIILIEGKASEYGLDLVWIVLLSLAMLFGGKSRWKRVLFVILTVALLIGVKVIIQTGEFDRLKTLKPLESRPVTEIIFKLVEQENLPPERILAVGGDNAYYLGWGRDCIILGLRLLFKLGGKKTAAIVAHELGHRAVHDWIVRMLLDYSPYILIPSVALFGVAPFPVLFSAFGFVSEPVAAVPVITLALGLIGRPLWVALHNTVILHSEYRADRHAIRLGFTDSLRLAMVRMHAEFYAPMTASFLYEHFFESHPPLIKRIEAIDREILRHRDNNPRGP